MTKRNHDLKDLSGSPGKSGPKIGLTEGSLSLSEVYKK